MFQRTKGGIITAKQHYTDYVDHILRFYARNDEKRAQWRNGYAVTFQTGLDLKNWAACDFVMQTLSPNDSAVVLYIYKQTGSMREIVSDASLRFKIPQNALWNLLNSVSRDIALQAGIIQSVTPGSTVTSTNRPSFNHG